MLFGVPTAQVAARLEALPAAFGISSSEALLLVQDEPQFLLVGADSLAGAWRELKRAGSLRPEWGLQIAGWTAATLRRCGVRGGG